MFKFSLAATEQSTQLTLAGGLGCLHVTQAMLGTRAVPLPCSSASQPGKGGSDTGLCGADQAFLWVHAMDGAEKH